jgi:mercuric ion binding protein
MKQVLMLVFSTAFLQVAFSQSAITESFRVYGNCGMCKKKIEGSLKDASGVSAASWDMDAKMMTVSFDKQAISLDDIKTRIAAVGYDSDTHRAKDEVYNNLHGCCKYERPKGKPKANPGKKKNT